MRLGAQAVTSLLLACLPEGLRRLSWAAEHSTGRKTAIRWSSRLGRAPGRSRRSRCPCRRGRHAEASPRRPAAPTRSFHSPHHRPAGSLVPAAGASGGRGGGRTGGRGSGGGRGTAAPLPPAPRPAPGAPDALQRLAAGVKQREDGRGPTPKAQHSRVEGVARPQPRHLHSVAVGELLGCSPLQAAAHAEQPWDLQMEQEESEELYQALPQPIPPPPRAACPSSPPAPSEVPAADFSRRDAARLGGDGVAGIFGGGVDAGEGQSGGAVSLLWCKPVWRLGQRACCGASLFLVASPLPHHGRTPSLLTAGTMRKSGAYMSALSSIKPGLSDAQKAKQVGRT